MPLYPALGKECTQEAVLVDARWVMSFASGLLSDSESLNNAYFDTTRTSGIMAHPMLHWGISWEFMLNRGDERFTTPMPSEEKRRGVHYKEHCIIHKPIRAGNHITMKCTPVQALRKSKGCTLTCRYDMFDDQGELLITHWTTDYYRDVQLGVNAVTHLNNKYSHLLPDVITPHPTQMTQIQGQPQEPIFTRRISIAANAAHVYTECARIWNPIHTDKAFALKAGLPDIILHGTAHFSKAVSVIIEEFAESDPARVKCLSCGAFGANVFLPCTVLLRVFSVTGGIVHFELLNEEGKQAVRNGVIVLEDIKSNL